MARIDKRSRDKRLLDLLLQVSIKANRAWWAWSSSLTAPGRRERLETLNARYDRLEAAVLARMNGGDRECTCNENHTCEAHGC